MGSSSSVSSHTQEAPPIIKNEQNMEQKIPTTDSRLPFTNFRELFTLKNFWKTVQRNKESCGKTMLLKMLTSGQEVCENYGKLSHLNLEDEPTVMSDPVFEKMAEKYLSLFDEVITCVESSPNDVQEALNTLESIGKMHKKVYNIDSGAFQSLEIPFLHMVEVILNDRYTDKAESLFRRFFQFCLIHVTNGYNSIS